MDTESLRIVPSRSTSQPGTNVRAQIKTLIELAVLDAGPDLPQPTGARATLCGQIEADILEAYELVRRSGRKPVILSVIRDLCRGCHLRLPAAVYNRFHGSGRVMACPHCLRLLYDPSWL